MESVHIGEVNSEVLIFLDKHYSTPLAALEEAIKILQREVIRRDSNSSRSSGWQPSGY